jgi:choline dehydrogenase-like flavoprotein
MVVVEDLLEPGNKVVMGRNGTPQVEYAGPSEYAKLGLQRALEKLPTLLAPLPVERIEFRSHRPTESHLQGTLRMGSDPASSVIDAKMIHHRWKNLTVVGSATFPSCSCANPSLTVAALSLRAAALA